MNKELSKLLESGMNMFTQDFSNNIKYPKYDIYYDNKDLVVIFEVPGLKKENIKLDFFNNILTIKCHKKKLFNKDVFQGDIDYGLYERNIHLPISVTSQDNVKINMENGMIIINIDIKQELKNKFSINL